MIAMKKIGQACLESEKFWKRQPEHGEIEILTLSGISEWNHHGALWQGVLVFSLTKQYTNMLNVIKIVNVLNMYIKEKYKV